MDSPLNGTSNCASPGLATAGWPAAPQAIYRLMMAAQQPMMLSWGPELTMVYNPPFEPILGSKHPAAFGRPYRAVWSEIWPTLAPLIAPVLTGQAVFFENMRFALAGRAQPESWFSFSITPVMDDAGAVGGFVVAVVETTETVLLQHRLQFGLQLGQALRQTDDRAAPMAAALQLLGEHLRVQRSAYVAVDNTARALSVMAEWTAVGTPGHARLQPLAVFSDRGLHQLQAGEPIAIDAGPEYAASWLLRAALVVPVVKNETLAALLIVEQNCPRAWSETDREVMRDVADRIWTAIARFQAEADVRALNRTLERRVAQRTAERDQLWRNAQELIIQVSNKDVLTSVNPASLAILGYRPKEMVGRPIDTFMHPDDLAELTAYRASGGHSRPLVENRFRHRDGSYRTIVWTVIREQGVAYATGRDMTAERAARTQLQDSEARLKAVFETSYQLQGLLDPDGRVLAMNATALAAIGGAIGDVVGRPFWETACFTGTPGAGPHIEGLVQAAARGESRRSELELVLSGGRRQYDLSVRPIHDDSGTLIAIMPEAIDTTDRRATEEALRQSQKMEAVGQLTGGLAHDFNNLLTGIGGALELIKIRLTEDRPTDATRYAAAAQDSVRRAASLTHRLLAFSRRQTLLPHLLDATALVAGMAELVRRTVGPTITVVLDLAPDLPAVLADANQLENAALNLCLNARDAMPGGGTLTLCTRHSAAQFDTASGGSGVVVEITDTGTGMIAEIAQRAFDPFFTTKAVGAGTGLGLSMVYGFVHQSGGVIAMVSAPGAGTTVTLTFPAQDAAVAPAVQVAPPVPTRGRGETVLVVEDDAAIQMLVDDVLQEQGYTVLLAGDGAGALLHLRSDAPIDLLVTDIGLPGGMNGREVADAARRLRPALPVLMMTGFAEAEVLGHNRLQHGMAIITKPFTMAALTLRIQELLGHSPAG